MKFHKLSIQNFMSVGDLVEIDFDQMSGVVFIKGSNLDVGPDASNGAGKSLMVESILYTIYGKTLRGLSKNEVINNKNQKRCSVILEFDDLRIERSRKPNKLRVWEDPNHEFTDETEISLSTMPKTEELILERVGVDYTTFCNIFCFGQHNVFSFISATEKTRRDIVEDLLSLSNYNICLETTRAALRTAKSEIKELTSKFEYISNELTNYKNSKRTREAEKEAKEAKIESEIHQLKTQLESVRSIDIKDILDQWKKYEKAQGQIPRVQEEVSKIETEIRQRKLEIADLQSKITTVDTKLNKINNLESGVTCEKCFMEIDPAKAKPQAEEYQTKKEELSKEVSAISDRLPNLQKAEEASRQFIQGLRSIQRPTKSRDEIQRVQAEVAKIEALIEEKNKKKIEDPYTPIIQELEGKILELDRCLTAVRKELGKKEKIVPYLDFWVQGFGPEGIRAFIVENIVGFLNNQVNYWLQFLIDNKIVVEFDKYLNVEIKRNTDEPFTYTQGSGGEKRRIDLAISLAFADLMRISNNTHNSLLFLDEVVDSLDFPGTDGTSKLINELSKNKTVFVISHNPNLLEQLDAKSQVNIVKQGGFSRFEGLSIL